MKNPKIQIYPSRNGQFGWRLIAKNGKKIACGGETYHNKKDLLKTLELVGRHFFNGIHLTVEDLTLKK